MSAQPSAIPPLPSTTNKAELVRLQKRLPPAFSLVAGMVDVIGFLTLKLFTAHVTGNLVVIAALMVRGGPPDVAQVLAVPVYLMAVAAAWMVARLSHAQGPALARVLLAFQVVLLTGVLILSISSDLPANPRGLIATVAAMMAVSAMAVQFSILRFAKAGPSTAVMTGNLTTSVLSLLEVVTGGTPLLEDPVKQLKKNLWVVGGFFVGCLAGAAADVWFGKWAWALPVVFAAMTVMIIPRSLATSIHVSTTGMPQQ
jgi:uncharacterized membrane protein YoaK (UPF0700 family)